MSAVRRKRITMATLHDDYYEHRRLLRLVKKLPQDFEPYGKQSREVDEYRCDCSCGCKFYRELDGDLGADWGVCTNPKSHRCGLLTFEHQGCLQFTVSRPGRSG